jgi:hypothetical protein
MRAGERKLLTHSGCWRHDPLWPHCAGYGSGQDNFVSHTMKAEEEKRAHFIEEHKSKAEVSLFPSLILPPSLPPFPLRLLPCHRRIVFFSGRKGRKNGGCGGLTERKFRLSAMCASRERKYTAQYSCLSGLRQVGTRAHACSSTPRCKSTYVHTHARTRMHAHANTSAHTCMLMHAHTQRMCSHAHVQVTNPLEPLMMSLVRGFVDDDDLTKKLCTLYQVKRDRDRLLGEWSGGLQMKQQRWYRH